MLKSTPLPRRWGDARAKIEQEGRCRVCGLTSQLEAAHVIGRRCDAILEGPKGGRYRYVHPDSIVPLCKRCHASFDRHELDLLPFMFWPEQVRAVEDAGGIIGALKRICGRAYEGLGGANAL